MKEKNYGIYRWCRNLIIIMMILFVQLGCSINVGSKETTDIHIRGRVWYESNRTPAPEATVRFYKTAERYNHFYGEDRVYTEELKVLSPDSNGSFEIRHKVVECKWLEIYLEATAPSDSGRYFYSPSYIIPCIETLQAWHLYMKESS